MPLALTRTEGRAVLERWLAEARVARDQIRLALPMSALSIGAGDVIDLPESTGATRYRVDRVSHMGSQLLEAVRIEPETYRHSDEVEIPGSVRGFTPPVPVFSLFLDLPLLTGDEAEVAPHIAVTGSPWPGSVALYSSASDSGYELNRLIDRKSVIGVTETPLLKASPGILDRGIPLRVRLFDGELSSILLDSVQNGANLAAIGDGSSANWELLQFTDAVLVAENTYEISGRIRGQAGTDALPDLDWPTGSFFVLLDGDPGQIGLKNSERGLERHYRLGPSRQPLDDPSYTHFVCSFEGAGLRPYAPVHLRAVRAGIGDVAVSWVRRTRIDGDSWQSVEVPIGEDQERYLLRVIKNAVIVREVHRSVSDWVYPQVMQLADGVAGGFSIHVAQLSDRYGAGPFRRIDVND